jgi:peptidoglycan hydrolase CwlO-like protein
MIIALLIPIILASTFIIYNLCFSKYFKESIKEGLETYDVSKDAVINKNTNNIKNLSSNISKIQNQLNKMTNAINKVKSTNVVNDSKLKLIEDEIEKTKNAIDEAQNQE